MANLRGQTLSVTATVQEANIAAAKMPLTLKNDDTTKTLWYKYVVSEQESGAIGVATVLRAANWCELKAGEAIILPSLPMLYYVAATSETLSARILAGTLSDALTGITTTTAAISASGSASELVADPGDGYEIWVFKLFGTLTAAGTVTLQDDGTPTTLTGAMSYDTNNGIALGGDDVLVPWIKCTASQALDMTITGGGTFNGGLTYAVVAV